MYWIVVLALSFTVTDVSRAGHPGLVGHWPFDEGAGAIAHDESGNDHHGTIVNATWESGQLGAALGFDGSAYVEVPAEAWASIETQVTVAFWTYVYSTPHNNVNFGALTIPAREGSRVAAAFVAWGGSIWWDTSGNPSPGAWDFDRTNKTVRADEYQEGWHHWAFVKNAETGRQEIYLDGSLGHSASGMTRLVKGAEVTAFTIGTTPTLRNFYIGMMDDFQLYNVALTERDIQKAMLGIVSEFADSPAPGDAAQDVLGDVILEWKPGEFAATHDVYFGSSFEDVNEADTTNPLGVLASQGQDVNAFDPAGVLDFGRTYFWRVDEVNGAPDFTVFKGKVWSFTVETYGRPITHITATASSSQANMAPEKTIDGSGLDALDQHGTTSTDMWHSTAADPEPWIQYEFDKVYKLHEMWVWNSNQLIELFVGMGAKEVVIETSIDGSDWTSLEGVTQFAQATGLEDYAANTVVDFAGTLARYVRITIKTGYGVMPQYGLSEVCFSFIPTNAREPEPADGAIAERADVTLSWRAGREAASHQVYLGTDAQNLSLLATTPESSLAAGTLDYAQTYYWSVTEVNEAETPPSHAGPIWRFTIPDDASVESFDQYDDDCNRIFFTWLDGIGHNGSEGIAGCNVAPYEGNLSASMVGNAEAPFAEKRVVVAGQSLSIAYDNSLPPYYSEAASADFALPGDWTQGSAEMLSLFYQGDAATANNDAEPLYVAVEDNAGNELIITHPNPEAVLATTWQKWVIPLSELNGIDLAHVKRLAIGVGKRTNPQAGGAGKIYVDEIRVGKLIVLLPADVTSPGDAIQGVPNDGDWPGAEAPDLAIDDSSATKYLHFKGATEATGFQVSPSMGATVVTGLTLTTANDAPERDPIAFELYGSNAGIDGPYSLIAAGGIADFSQGMAWPRFGTNETPIWFENYTAYAHYQVLFTAVRDAGSANSMQIAEVELNGVLAPLPRDVTKPGDTIRGVPYDLDWPTAEAPEFVIDNDIMTKYLHFKGPTGTAGFQVTPSAGTTVVTGLTFTTANDAAERDPIAYELSGSNTGIEGPFTVIAAGDIVDFSQGTAWPRLTANETQIKFDNTTAYAHYQLTVTAVRDAGSANSMQIAEVELNGVAP